MLGRADVGTTLAIALVGEDRRNRQTNRCEILAVTKTIPPYLRLHAAPKRKRAVTRPLVADPVSHFWQAFTATTGWAVEPAGRKRGVAKSTVPGGGGRLQLRRAKQRLPLSDGAHAIDGPALSEASAQRLAVAASRLSRQYQQSLVSIQNQEAELAAIAMPAEVGDQSGQLASRLQQLLQQAMAATTCDAGAVYLLDEETSSLKMRACAGLPASRLMHPPRPLRGSRADLESLVRDVVLINELDGPLSTTWNSPERYAAAIVVRLQDSDLPIGTLWLWSSTAQTFSERDGSTAQLAAGAIASELARAKLSRQRHRWSISNNALQTAAQWQMRQLPPAMELAPGYFVDGWTESPRPWACSWHAWDILPDGTIALALAQAEPTELHGAMIAATARAAFAAHSNYRHSVTEMLSRVSDSLWQTNTGDQIVSMLYAHVNPETGEGRIASAGSIQAIIAGGRGFRPLCSGAQSDPLASRVDCRLAHTDFRLQGGEVLTAVNRGVLDPAVGLAQNAWADVVRQSVMQPSAPVLPAIRRALASSPLELERAGLTLFRQH